MRLISTCTFEKFKLGNYKNEKKEIKYDKYRHKKFLS